MEGKQDVGSAMTWRQAVEFLVRLAGVEDPKSSNNGNC